MNGQEFWSDRTNFKCYEYKFVKSKLKEWKRNNGITGCCVVHHRDDTEEVRAYNEAHYERWGFNDNGEFIEGQYVIFMTKSAHSSYHHRGKHISDEMKQTLHFKFLGENNPQYGLRGKNSPNYGKHHSAETRKKISESQKGRGQSTEVRKKISESNLGKHDGLKSISYMYNAYKLNGGILKWNEFQKALKNGEITFEMHPITVYTKEINK